VEQVDGFAPALLVEVEADIAEVAVGAGVEGGGFEDLFDRCVEDLQASDADAVAGIGGEPGPELVAEIRLGGARGRSARWRLAPGASPPTRSGRARAALARGRRRSRPPCPVRPPVRSGVESVAINKAESVAPLLQVTKIG